MKTSVELKLDIKGSKKYPDYVEFKKVMESCLRYLKNKEGILTETKFSEDEINTLLEEQGKIAKFGFIQAKHILDFTRMFLMLNPHINAEYRRSSLDTHTDIVDEFKEDCSISYRQFTWLIRNTAINLKYICDPINCLCFIEVD